MLRRMIDLLRVAIAFGLSVIIGGIGFWRGSLTPGGWLGAIVVGTSTAGWGGWTWGVLVVAFFVSSSALSRWRHGDKARVADDKFAKGDRRDMAQTLANGGATAALALFYAVDPQSLLFAAGLGALATVTADTWATELGTLSSTPPRLITTGHRVAPGTSGGVTLLGVVAAISAALIGDVPGGPLLLAATCGGIAGSLADSLLGATVQQVRWCPCCAVETEQPIHRCGTTTAHRRGFTWLNNDGVNFAASLAGAGVALLIFLVADRTAVL
jgi:uncharacterized protein (TIGR00297 family)